MRVDQDPHWHPLFLFQEHKKDKMLKERKKRERQEREGIIYHNIIDNVVLPFSASIICCIVSSLAPLLKNSCVTYKQTHTHTQTDMQTDKQTDTHTHTDKQTHRQTHTETHTHTDRHRQTQTYIQTHTDTHRQTNRHTYKHIHRHTQTKKEIHKHTAIAIFFCVHYALRESSK